MWSRESRSRAVPSRKAGSGRRALQMKKAATMITRGVPASLVPCPAAFGLKGRIGDRRSRCRAACTLVSWLGMHLQWVTGWHFL